MKRFFAQPLGLLCAVFVLFGCDHRGRVDPAQASNAPVAQTAVARDDSELTGEAPASPVAPAAAKPVPAATAAAASSSEAQSAPVTVSSPSASVPASLPDSNPSPAASPAPASSSEANSDTTRLAMNSPQSPVVATTPSPTLDEAESQMQVVGLETSLGRIVIELDDIYAPRTCGNFRKLVSDGFYNHTIFHRVIPSFMIQGGDPNSKSDDRATYGQGDPGYTLPAEIRLKHTVSAVAMARLPDSANPQRDSNGSQFFICVAPCPSLDDQYTVFGHVIKGLDTAIQIANQPRDKRDDPVTRIEMKARMESKKQALEQSTAGL